MKMKKTIYRQTDSRWAKLPYPSGGYTIGGSGCGCCAIANIIIQLPKHAKDTPRTIQPYMKQWARCGDGTLRRGITEAMNHYGFKDVIRHDTMASLWKECAKGNRVGVLLMGSKTVGGVQWTTSAHYVAFADYMKKDGKHYLWIKDSGWRHHDGWYPYETTFRGNVLEAWSGSVPQKKKLTPNGKTRRDICLWAKKIAADNSYHYMRWDSHDRKTHECPICHKHPEGKYHGFNCIGFAMAAWHHGGHIPCKCSCGVFDNSMATRWLNLTATKALAEIRAAFGIRSIKLIRNRRREIPVDKLLRGDILLSYDDKGIYKHTAVYLGKGKIADATPQHGEAIRSYKSLNCLVAIRYTGRGKY